MTSTVASSLVQGGAIGMMSFCPGINYPNYRDKYAGHSQWLDQSTEMNFSPLVASMDKINSGIMQNNSARKAKIRH